MTITARFSSICPNCQQRIQVGESVEWSRGRKAEHVSCQPATPRTWNEDADDAPEDPRSPHYRKSCRQPETCPLHAPQQAIGRPTSAEVMADYDARTAKARRFANVGTDNDDRSYDAWLAARDSAWMQSDTQVARTVAFNAARKLTVDDAGVYVLVDGSIVNVKSNQAKTAVYPELWVVIGGSRLTEAGAVEHGEYRYFDDWTERRAMSDRVATEGRKMTQAEAKAFSIRFGVCVRCAAALKDAKSVSLGVGPVCKRYIDMGAALEAPIVETEVIADDDEENPVPLPRPSNLRARQVENWLTAKRSRWSRPDDDELESAAY